MATLLLLAASAAAPAGAISTGAFFALSIGAAYIDSTLVYPALFPPETVKGERLNNFEFQHAEEGAPENRLFGKEVRCVGTLKWAGAMREFVNTARGGKAGRGAEFVKYKYKRHLAVEICRLKRGKQIKRVRKVLADGRPFYDPFGLGTTTSNKIGAAASGVNVGYSITTPIETRYFADIYSDEDAGGPDLTAFQSGQFVTISGFTSTHTLTTPTLNVHVESTGATSLMNGAGDQYVLVAVQGTGTLSVNDTIVLPGGTAGASVVYTITSVRLGNANPFIDSDRPYPWWIFQSADFTGTVPAPQAATIRLHIPLVVGIADGTNAPPTSGAPANNGTFLCTAVSRTATGRSKLTIEGSDVSIQQFCSKPPETSQSVTITQDDRTFSELIVGDIRFYFGTADQGQDPTLVAVEATNVGGAANVPAFRGRAYMFVEDLDLTDFGNRIPNFEFIVEVEDDDSVANACAEILRDVGLAENDFDISLLPTTMKLGGYVMRGVQNTKAAFQPIVMANHLLAQQTDKLRFFQRTAATLINVTGKTVAFAPGNRAPRPAQIKQAGDNQVASKVEVKFFDPANDYNIAARRSLNPLRTSSVDTFDTNLAMSDDDAKKLANTLYEFTRTSGRQAATITLPPSYIPLVKESVRLQLDAFGQSMQFLVLRAEIGANFILNCEVIQDDLEAFTQTQVSEGTLA